MGISVEGGEIVKKQRIIIVVALLLAGAVAVIWYFRSGEKKSDEKMAMTASSEMILPTVTGDAEVCETDIEEGKRYARGAVSNSMMEIYYDQKDASMDVIPEDPYYVMDSYNRTLEHDMGYADLWLECVEVYHWGGRDVNLILLTFEKDHHAVVMQERNLRGEITYNFYGDDAETYRFTLRHGILVKDVSEAEAEVDRINRKEFTHTASNQDVLAEDPSLWQTFQEKLDAKICMIQYVTGSTSDYGITNEGRFFYEATRYDGTLAEGTGAICGIQVDRDGSKNTALLIQNDGKHMLAEFQARGDGSFEFENGYVLEE